MAGVERYQHPSHKYFTITYQILQPLDENKYHIFIVASEHAKALFLANDEPFNPREAAAG